MFAAVLVLALAFAASRLLNKRIYETLPVAVFVMTLAVYVFALFLPLNAAVWICVGITVIAVVMPVLVKMRSGDGSEVSKSDVSKGKVLFDNPVIPALVLSCVMFCLLVSGHRVFYYDDLSYWGLYTKNIFSINKLPHLFENCSVDYKDYTPIMQVLQYIAMFGR